MMAGVMHWRGCTSHSALRTASPEVGPDPDYVLCTVYSDKVTMGLLVNFSPGGEGIESVVADNLTCSCDSVSCTCLHYAHYSHTQHSVCDDHCILSITILASLGMCSVLVLTMLTRKWRYCHHSLYQPAKTQELDLAEMAEESRDSYSSTYQYPHPVMVGMHIYTL